MAMKPSCSSFQPAYWLARQPMTGCEERTVIEKGQLG
jgi:hypothetical protein